MQEVPITPNLMCERVERLMRPFEKGQAATNDAFRRLERIPACNYGVEKWWRWEPLVD